MKVLEDAYIQITKDCNQECIFCSQPKEKIYLPFKEVKKIILNFRGEGFKSFVLTGGEPTLHKELIRIVSFLSKLGVNQRIITNGVLLSDEKYCKMLKEAGLRRAIISIHSHIRKKAREISGGKDNLKKTLKAIENLIKLGIVVHINTTIISQNKDHLLNFTKFMVKRFPEIEHYCFNFVDVDGRAAENTFVVPKLSDVELELSKTLSFLRENEKSFRIERVPLCYMCDFEEFSSETRRILSSQEYYTFFLRERRLQKSGKETAYKSEYFKADCCDICFLDKYCAGVKKGYALLHGVSEIYPLFKNPQKVFGNKKIRD